MNLTLTRVVFELKDYFITGTSNNNLTLTRVVFEYFFAKFIKPCILFNFNKSCI